MDAITEMVNTISLQAVETQEKFMFEKMSSWMNDITQMEVSKRDLEIALLRYYQKPIDGYMTIQEVIDLLKKIQWKIKNLENPYESDVDNILLLAQHNAFYEGTEEVKDIIEDTIDELKEKA